MDTQESKAQIFDVFLCHNTVDKSVVREIAQMLVKEGIRPWLDVDQIRPGTPWQTALGEQIENIKSAAVFVGENGIGPWQNEEIQAFLSEFVSRKCPVIPTMLADATKTPELPWTLRNRSWVDFRVSEPDPLKQLIWGITGVKSIAPEPPVPPAQRPERYWPPLAQAPDQEQAIQLNILRKRVSEDWVDGVLKHSLYNEVLISLEKREIDKAVDAPWKYTVEMFDEWNSTQLDDRDVSVIYDATGLLLILGEPGSGKTTTLLDLARTLLERAKQDIKERVPIVVNLSSWKKKQSLVEWISSELSEKYRVPRKIGHFWLQRGYLLPLMDGLDEVEISTQLDCVTAINAFIEQFQPAGLVVCCRLNEYRWLPKRLKLNGAICIEPLSSDEVSKYLEAGGPKLATLREAIDADPVIHELSQTPLMLSIMSLAYQGVRGGELVTQKGDSDERRKQIFRLYVQQMFQRRAKGSSTFPKEKIIDWVSWIARKMREHSQSVFLVEGLQPSWLDKTAERLGYEHAGASIIGLVVGLIVGLILGLSFGLSKGPNWALKGGLMGVFYGGLAGGLVGLIMPALGIGLQKNITLVETVSWEWNKFWKETIRHLIVGLTVRLKASWKTGREVGREVGGIIVGLYLGRFGKRIGGLIGESIGGLIGGLFIGLIVGLPVGLIGGLLSGLSAGFTDRVKMDKALPNQGINLSLKNSLTVFLVISIPVGAIGGLIGWLGGAVKLVKEVPYWCLFFGLFFGVITGLNRGGSAVIKHYALRLILWRRGYTSFNFIKFLDHSAKLIFLKKLGGGYIFIHRMLLDYFADLNPESTKGWGRKRDQS